MNAIRWILVLPGAVIGGLLGRFLYLILNNVGMVYALGIDAKGSFWWNLSESCLGGVALGATTVFVASFISPTHKRKVAIIMVGLILVCAGLLLTPTILDGNYWALLETVSIGFGGVGIAHGIWTKEITFGNK
jgi:hypothetical protein